MTNDTNKLIEAKKQELRAYKNIMQSVDRLIRKRLELQNRLVNVSSPKLTDEPRGSGPRVSQVDLISKCDELDARIESLEEKANATRRKILLQIDALDDVRYAEVLESYFIDGLTIEDIADAMGYQSRHVYRLYKKGIKILALRDEN